MVYVKVTKVIPPLRRPKLSKNHKKRRMKYKKLYEANRYWNVYKFQLHWHKLEWVNPRIQIKSIKPSSVSSKTIYINKGDRTAHWVGHSKLK